MLLFSELLVFARNSERRGKEEESGMKRTAHRPASLPQMMVGFPYCSGIVLGSTEVGNQQEK